MAVVGRMPVLTVEMADEGIAVDVAIGPDPGVSP